MKERIESTTQLPGCIAIPLGLLAIIEIEVIIWFILIITHHL